MLTLYFMIDGINAYSIFQFKFISYKKKFSLLVDLVFAIQLIEISINFC